MQGHVADQVVVVGAVSNAAFTGAIGAAGTGTCVITSAVLTVATVTANETISIGDTLAGTLATKFPASTTFLNQLTGSPGQAGTYTMSAACTTTEASNTAFDTDSNVLNVTTLATGTIYLGDTVSGASGTPVVESQVSGTVGGVGVYTINGSAQFFASGSLTTTGSAQSQPFNPQTSFLRLIADVSCSIAVALAPIATTSSFFLAENEEVIVGVPAGLGWSIAVIANT